MHTLQHSKSRHNIFSETDHDRKHIDTISTKSKGSKKHVGFVDSPAELRKSPSSSVILPDIDLNVRKKLASNDLQVKFAHKSNVLTVASTLAKGRSGTFPADDEIMDDLELTSTKSNYSDTLEALKRQMADEKSTPLMTPSRSFTDSAFSPTTTVDIAGDLSVLDEPWKEIDEYDDEDHGKFGSTIAEHEYSRTDAKLYKSTLDAHQSFMKNMREKNSMKVLKSMGSSKTLPAAEMLDETKKARSVLESASLSPSVKPSSPSGVSPLSSPQIKSPHQLKPLTSSFMFLTALTMGRVSKVAKEDQEQSILSPEEQAPLSTKSRVTFASETSAFGFDENKSLSPAMTTTPVQDQHFRAPLDNTDSPIHKPAISTKTFSRFAGSKNQSASTVLRSIKSMDRQSSRNLLQPINSPEGEQKTDPEATTYEKLKRLVEGPNYQPSSHEYEIPQLNALNNDRSAFLKGMDNVVNNLTYVKAPDRPKTPEAAPAEPLTLQTVFGEQLIIHSETSPLPEEEYNRLVFGDPQVSFDHYQQQLVEAKKQSDLINPYKKLKSIKSMTKSPTPVDSSQMKKQSPMVTTAPNSHISSPLKPLPSPLGPLSPNTSQQSLTYDDSKPLLPSSYKQELKKPVLPLPSSSAKKDLNTMAPHVSSGGSDRFDAYFIDPNHPSNDSMRSDYSSATFVDYNPLEPSYPPHNDPRLPPLDLSIVNQKRSQQNPSNQGQTNNNNTNWSTTASISSALGASNDYQPPPRRRSFLNLGPNPYGMMRASFLRNFNKKHGTSTDSTEERIGRTGSTGSHLSSSHNNNNPQNGGVRHGYTRSLSQSTQQFISSIVKTFSRSQDPNHNNNKLTNTTNTDTTTYDPYILPSEDYYQPKYYVLNEGNDFADDDSFTMTPKPREGISPTGSHHTSGKEKNGEEKRRKQDYKLDSLQQPLSNPQQEYIYQHSTNSYVPKDFINHSSYGFYQRGQLSPRWKEEIFSERHIQKIEDTTTGNCAPVIYLPPNFAHTATQIQEASTTIGEEEVMMTGNGLEGEEMGEDHVENQSIHSHEVLKVYHPPSRTLTSPYASTASLLSPGVVLAEPSFDRVVHLADNPDPKQPHYIHHQPSQLRLPPSFDEEEEEEEEGKEKSRDINRNSKDRSDSEGMEKPKTELVISPSDIHSTEVFSPPPAITKSKSTTNKTTAITPFDTNPNPNPDKTSQTKSILPTKSALDLRDEIADFLQKTNSPVKQEYEQYIKKTTPTPSLSHGGSVTSPLIDDTGSIHSLGLESKRSLQSDATNMSQTPEQAHQKLWEKLHTRYSGDREGEYHTRIKVKQYLKEAVKEETQIMKQYLEEIDEWKD